MKILILKYFGIKILNLQLKTYLTHAFTVELKGQNANIWIESRSSSVIYYHINRLN